MKKKISHKTKINKKKTKIEEDDLGFPKTRAGCADVPRPCPFVRCRHNTFLDVNPSSGKLKAIFPNCETPLDMKTNNCTLDIVEQRGMMTLEDIGRYMNITRERVRQIADAGIRKLRIITEDD